MPLTLVGAVQKTVSEVAAAVTESIVGAAGGICVAAPPLPSTSASRAASTTPAVSRVSLAVMRAQCGRSPRLGLPPPVGRGQHHPRLARQRVGQLQ